MRNHRFTCRGFRLFCWRMSFPLGEDRIQVVTTSNDERLRELYTCTSRRVYAYLRRHADPDVAESVLAEVYVKAWRHLGSVPEEPMGWLIVTAKRLLIDHHRSQQRRNRLADEMFSQFRTGRTEGLATSVVERHALLECLRKLTEDEREALLLVGWDGLDHASAAKVAGCSTAAFTKRLLRARKKLIELMDSSMTAPALRSVPGKV